jgi:hypothetical protein
MGWDTCFELGGLGRGESLLFGKGQDDDEKGGFELCKGPSFFCSCNYYRIFINLWPLG